MGGRRCHHCHEWVEPGTPHDCSTTTERALTRDLPEDLFEAWQRLRETLAAFGEQRIYASHNSIMFSRTACYAFVRPKTSRLEVCFFLGRTVRSPQIQRAAASSRVKVAHLVHVRHRDQVEAPLTDWLREAYDESDRLSRKTQPRASRRSIRSGRVSDVSKPAARGQPAPDPSAGGTGPAGRSPGARDATGQPARRSTRAVAGSAPRRPQS